MFGIDMVYASNTLLKLLYCSIVRTSEATKEIGIANVIGVGSTWNGVCSKGEVSIVACKGVSADSFEKLGMNNMDMK